MPKVKSFEERRLALRAQAAPLVEVQPEDEFSPGDLSQLPPKQRVAVVHILCGQGDARVAKLVGVTRQTIHNWRKDPRFQAHLQALRRDLGTMLQDRLSSMAIKALDTIDDLLSSKDARIRLAAAKAVIRALNAGTSMKADKSGAVITEIIRRTEL
jgi:DNA-binding XRE family transcriptional regulator